MFHTRRSQWLRVWMGAIALSALLGAAGPAAAFDDSKYPDLSGQWLRINLQSGGQPSFDPTKAWGLGQKGPYTPEYQAVLEASIADQANGGQGNWYSGAACLPPGMPGTMNGYNSMEMIVLPEITYVLIDHNLPIHRRIYTDGRDWPKEADGTFQGYSIGKWIDSDGAGRFDTLEVETRDFKGPRSMDAAGLPLAADNQTIIKERFRLDKADPKRLYDDITLIDHALTRPWTATKLYRRSAEEYPSWAEQNCPSTTRLVKIGNELYFKGADDKLLPTRKDQPPPDLKYFSQSRP